MDKEIPPRRKSSTREDKKKAKQRAALKWSFFVLVVSFVVTAALSFLSGEALNDLPMIVALIILLLFIVVGIVFDMIGLAVATADIKAFNSMAARRVKHGKKAVSLIKNAERVSSVCNDVVGDIAGVVSGATSATIAAKLFANMEGNFWLSLALTSLVAALIVGGKAFCKSYAIKYSNKIVDLTARVLCVFSCDKSKAKKSSEPKDQRTDD